MDAHSEHHDDKESSRRKAPERGPGAHSRREQPAQDRIVPGTASAAEGYSRGGTAEGEALKGVEAEGRKPKAAEED